MSELNPEQIQQLDRVRQQLLALQQSISVLTNDLQNPEKPLPTWSEFQGHATSITRNLSELSSQVSERQQLLASAVPFPLLTYPANGKDHVIEALFRTKLEPDVEEWVEQGEIQRRSKTGAGIESALSDAERRELWQWAPGAANAEARKQKWGADYTLAEVQDGVEKVLTGLKRELDVPPEDEGDSDGDDYDDDEEDEEEEEGHGAEKPDTMDLDNTAAGSGPRSSMISAPKEVSRAPQMPLGSVHKFMTTGKVG